MANGIICTKKGRGMNKKIAIIIAMIMCSLLGHNAWGWHVTVYNDTDSVVEATCKKAGAIKVNSELIQPKESAECDCGGADCSTGINIVVYELYTGPDGLMYAKDINLSDKWTVKCANKTIHVVSDGKGKFIIK